MFAQILYLPLRREGDRRLTTVEGENLKFLEFLSMEISASASSSAKEAFRCYFSLK